MLWNTFEYLGGGVAGGCGCGTVHLSGDTKRGLCKSKKPIMGCLGEGSIRKEQAWENKEKEERYKRLVTYPHSIDLYD